MDELLADFIAETNDKLAEAQRAMRRLGRVPDDPAALSQVFRAVHSIKGTGGFLGLARLEQVLHSAEDALGRARDAAAPVAARLVADVSCALADAKLIVAGLSCAGSGPEPACPPESDARTELQPIGRAWASLPLLTRKLAGELGKQVDLVLFGRSTRLDQGLLALVRDSMAQLVRNSADHGIETPPERVAAGKPVRGRITLSARHEGGHVLIEVSDDGRGLAMDRIRATALRRGLATATELAAMPDEQAQRFILHAGFTTASAVTAVSGRGVGLDVVHANIERVRGTIDLASRPGRGTTITIRIPMRAGRGERPALLVVEDNPLFRRMLLSALAAFGLAATAVGNAGEALALLGAGSPYDAIISDIEMPGMDGLAFARLVRAGGTSAALPMVALSGRSGKVDVEAALAAGFTEHVAKFDRRALAMALERCLASRTPDQYRPPRAAIGQTHSTRPARTPTYQS